MYSIIILYNIYNIYCNIYLYLEAGFRILRSFQSVFFVFPNLQEQPKLC